MIRRPLSALSIATGAAAAAAIAAVIAAVVAAGAIATPAVAAATAAAPAAATPAVASAAATPAAPPPAPATQAPFQPQPQPQQQPQPQPQPAGYSAASLYNLANAYARAGKPGFAVLNYERARLLDPTDADIDANLRHVRAVAGIPPETQSRLDRLARIAGPSILAWVGVLGFVIAGVSVLAWRRYPRRRLALLVTTLGGLSLLGVTLLSAATLWPVMRTAVVIAPAAQVRVSPVIIGDPLFELPEATVVTTSAEHDGFVLIRTTAGRSGWVPGTSLAPLIPRK